MRRTRKPRLRAPREDLLIGLVLVLILLQLYSILVPARGGPSARSTPGAADASPMREITVPMPHPSGGLLTLPVPSPSGPAAASGSPAEPGAASPAPAAPAAPPPGAGSPTAPPPLSGAPSPGSSPAR